MNGINSSKKERSYSNETDNHQLPEKEQQSNEKEKKGVESPSGFTTMSPLQKFFFVLSLLLSVLYVVAFAWLIPCKPPDETDNTDPIVVTEEWKLNFSEIDVSTNLILTKELNNGSRLLFGYKSLDNEPSGLISIHRSEGKVHWKKELSFVPRYIFCDRLEVSVDNKKECIIIGDNGSVASLNLTTETLTWTKNPTQSSAYETVSVPAVIPDCDSDGINDLAVAYSEFSSSDGGRFPDSVSIEILSGRTGNVIGFRKPVNECTSTINKVQLWKRAKSHDVLIYCNDNNGFGNFWKITAGRLCSEVSKETAPLVFERVYSIENPGNKQLNMMYLPTKNLYSVDEDMLVAWKGGDIIRLSGVFDVVWHYSANTTAEIRALLIGQFTNDSDHQVAMINSDKDSGTMLTVLQIETGNKLMSTLHPKYFITEALPLQNVFFGTDGILLKHRKVQSEDSVKDTFMHNNSSVDRQPMSKFVVREEYLISRPGCSDNGSFKFVTSEKVTKFLQHNATTRNKIEYNPITAAVRNSDAEDSLELFIASTSSSLPAEKNSLSQRMNINKLTTVKLLHLSHKLFSKNNTCECSC